MVLPQVIGYRITGHLSQLATSTDVVLTVCTTIKSLYILFNVINMQFSVVGHETSPPGCYKDYYGVLASIYYVKL